MNKSLESRIAYYVRKVKEARSHHPSKKLPRAYTFRSQRLRVYKGLMD
ncbi:hypothetical protein [Bacillus infantis]|nr:hypothetical protein [Bacillus infantis]